MIVLLGMPRSGSTWVGKIFDSHPDTFYCHEPDTAERLAMPLFPPVADWEKHRDELQALRGRLDGPLPLRVVGKMPLFPKRYRGGLGNRTYAARIWAAKLASRAGMDWRVPAPGSGSRSVPVWKSIESLGRAGTIAGAWSEARVLLLLRNPCAYVASIIRGERAGRFSGAQPQSDDYGIFRQLLETEQARRWELTEDRLRAATPEQRLAWRWLLCNEKALDDTQGLSNCLAVRYEDICEAPAAQARALFSHAGLDWDSQSEAFLNASTSRTDDRYYAVFKDPAEAAGRWKSELDPAVVSAVAGVVAGTRAGDFYPEVQGL